MSKHLRQASSLYLTFIFLFCFFLFSTGCGGGGDNDSRNGQIQVRVAWPTRSRLIPKSARRIEIALRDQGGKTTQKTLYRNSDSVTATATFSALASGPYVLLAAAYPDDEYTGQAAQAITLQPVQASGSSVVRINLSLDTTITRLELEGAPDKFVVGDRDTIVARAYDSDNNFVVTYEKAIQCVSSDPTIVRVNNDTNAFEIEALAPGTARLTVTDTETGLSANATVRVSVPSTEPTPSPPTNDGTPNTLKLPTNDIIYSRKTGKIYASIGSSYRPNGNSIAVIDPVTQQVETTIPIGSEPGPLALSDDGNCLYVGLTGANLVARYNFAEGRKDQEFGIGDDANFGSYRVVQIAVMPGTADTIAVVRSTSSGMPFEGGVAIFDNGVPRPVTIKYPARVGRIAFASPSRIYGFNNGSTSFDFSRLSVDANGVSLLDSRDSFNSDLIAGFGTDIVFAEGRIYSTTGRVVDPEKYQLLGTFAASGPFVVDTQHRRIFYVDTLNPVKVRAFDLDSFLPVAEVSVPNMERSAAHLIRWGDKGLAYHTSGGNVYFVPEAPGL